MKILFVSSGNSVNGISSITMNQGESLKKAGIDIDFFTIKGSGRKGYLKNAWQLNRYLKNNKYDIVHAHYSLSAFVASFAGAKPLIVSLMGTDVKSKRYYKFLIKYFHRYFWSKTIVKSCEMKNTLSLKQVNVIPNGVDFNHFRHFDKKESQNRLGWSSKMFHVLFAANPNISIKNFQIAQEAFELIDDDNVELHCLENIANIEMVYHYNSSDVVLLTSKYEGSPNVIKEAMACNIPIVSVNVGDVKRVIGKTKGCYICSYKPEDVACNIKEALAFGKRTNGRENIKYLDSKQIAKQIVSIYNSVI